MGEALVETGKDRVGSVKGTLAMEQLKDGWIVVLATLPVRIRHGDLVRIRQERIHERVGGWLQLQCWRR